MAEWRDKAQIDAARAEPTSAEIEAEMQDAQLERASQADAVFPIDATCAHAMWTTGCESCAAWAVKNGVAFARQMAARDTASAYAGIDPTPPDTVTLSGAKLAAYRQLEAAATAAHGAQQAMTSTGQALRDAIQAMCTAMAPGKSD